MSRTAPDDLSFSTRISQLAEDGTRAVLGIRALLRFAIFEHACILINPSIEDERHTSLKRQALASMTLTNQPHRRSLDQGTKKRS